MRILGGKMGSFLGKMGIVGGKFQGGKWELGGGKMGILEWKKWEFRGGKMGISGRKMQILGAKNGNFTGGKTKGFWGAGFGVNPRGFGGP